jgi:hypothetical protein
MPLCLGGIRSSLQNPSALTVSSYFFATMKLDRDTFSEVFMIPLSSTISDGLTWSKIPRSRSYELKLNGEVVATLQRPSAWSCNFRAETQDGRWTFRRGGFLGTGAEMVDATSERRLATFKSAWAGGGTLTFADGQTFHLRCKGLWRPAWIVTTESGHLVLQLHSRGKTVELGPGAGLSVSRLSLLIAFAWYRVLQAEEDAAAVAVMVAT